jgi:hypothetical protein
VNGACVARCGNGQYRDNAGKCVCPGQYDFFQGQCVQACAKGATRLSTTSCVCPFGQEEVGEWPNAFCSPICGGGQVRTWDGKCTCSAGQTLVLGQCSGPCPNGATRNALTGGGFCPNGQEYVHGYCQTECAQGAARDSNGRCYCPAAMEPWNGVCVETCRGGTYRNSVGACTCSGGSTQYYNGVCVQACPSGSVRNAQGLCVSTATCARTIRPGDTFNNLEDTNGWARGTLSGLNPGVNVYLLQPGQTINAPCSGNGGSFIATNICKYIVRSGEDYGILESRYGWPSGVIQPMNPGQNPRTLQPNQQINVPCNTGACWGCPCD